MGPSPLGDAVGELTLDDGSGSGIEALVDNDRQDGNQENASLRKDVEDEECHEKRQRDHADQKGVVDHDGEGHTPKRWRQQHSVPKEHQALVHDAVIALPDSDRDDGTKDEDAEDVADKKGLGREDGRKLDSAADSAEGGERAEDDHQAGKDSAEDSEFAVKANVAGGDQAGLDDEEDDPGREDSTVQMHEEAGKSGEDCAPEKVAGSKADDNDAEHDEGHRREEDVVCALGDAGRGDESSHGTLVGWILWGESRLRYLL